jgi:hypothetical protein
LSAAGLFFFLGLFVLNDTSVTARTVKANPPMSSTLAQNFPCSYVGISCSAEIIPSFIDKRIAFNHRCQRYYLDFLACQNLAGYGTWWEAILSQCWSKNAKRCQLI